MIEQLWVHSSGNISEKPIPIDNPWIHNVRSQIFCRNQEEHDYLSSLNLMHGREVEINIWNEWLGIRSEIQSGNGKVPRVLPIAYTTWHVNLRGL